jgi:DNA (cytosine-5)-methyltransferase 1
VTDLVLGTFGGPGGWPEGARALGIREVGIELDGAACATRRAAGHRTIRADVSRFPVGQLAGKTRGQTHSPPCTTFSAAGDQAGNAVMEMLAALTRDMFAGRDTRERCRREMTAELIRSEWRTDLADDVRAVKIARSVTSAALVAEPARFIVAGRPEWVALEQVPAVLPLWQVYAAELRQMGYSAWCGKLNAADYGVPQTRERAILIASRVREVWRPEPTHYDPRKGDQLWGTPWVSMAEALGWGATERPAPTATAGGTATGGAEPFGHRDRDALEAEREAGRWALRIDAQRHATLRSASAPAPALKFGHSAAEMQWVLHRGRGSSCDADRRDHPGTEPAPTITSADGKAGANLTWKFRNNNNNNACERSVDEPAGTLFFGQRSNWAAWVTERPSTTVQGDPRIGRPGHKDRAGGEAQFEQESVRITVQEAAILQSFPADYPWQGSKTKQFEQCGNAVPPRLAAHILSMATGIPLAASLEAGWAA